MKKLKREEMFVKFLKILVISAFFMLASPFSSYSMVEKDPMVRAFTAAGVQIESFDVADWSRINEDFMEFSDLEEIAEKAFTVFQTSGEKYSVSRDSDDMYRVVTLESPLSDGNYVRIVVQTVKLPEEFEKEPQTYLAVSVTGSDAGKLKDIKQKVARAIRSSGGQSRITTCLAGVVYGRFNWIEVNEITNKILEELKVEYVEKMEDLEMQNFIGYSPLLKDSLEIMGKEYNVNLAVRYSEEDDRTYIWLGVPVLSIDY
ncbi:MAG: YwmB family TATA-box binding protein [Bacillota bacterium]